MSETFGIVDACIFIGMIVVAVGIGLFYGIKDRNKKSLKDYFYAEQRMSTIPVGISLGVTFISSITILSIPVLTYTRGSVVFWYSLVCVVSTIPAFLYFIPFFQSLQMSSIYQYLELRFHSSVRKACSGISCVLMTFWMGVALYLTSLALNVVFPLTITQSTLLTTVIVTFYSVVGGIKAVVWVDTVQSLLMVAGVITVSIRTSNQIGGISRAWEVMREDQRDTFLTFDPDVTVQYSFWTIVMGLGTTYAQYYCCNQAFVQRFQTCRNTKQARIACIISAVLTSFLMAISVVCGCVMYPYFKGCDPHKSGQILYEDQTVPFLVIQIFKDVPGVAGLFVSAAYSAMLSTVSSGINSLSTLVLEDFVLSFVKERNEKREINISRLIGVLVGITVMFASFAIRHLGDIAFVLINTIESAFCGPLLGLFVCGVFIPWANKVGSLIGFLSGVIINLWIAIGYRIYGSTPGRNLQLSVSIENCTSLIMTSMNKTTDVSIGNSLPVPERPWIADSLYQVSYFYYSLIGLFSSVIISVIVSCITGRRDPRTSDPAFFIPLLSGKFLPKKIERFFRFDVPVPNVENSQYFEMLRKEAKPNQPGDIKKEAMDTLLISTPLTKNLC